MSTSTTTPSTVAQPVQLHRRAPAAQPLAADAWTIDAIQALLDKPLMDLLFEAQTVHRQHWPAGDIEPGHAAVGQNGRLPRKLRLLPAGGRV